MTRFLLIGIALILGAEVFRAWWFHGAAVSGEGNWEETPRLILDEKRMDKETPLGRFSVGDYVDTGALQYDRASFFRVAGENEDTTTDEGIAAPPEGPLPSLLFLEYHSGNENLWNDLFTHPPEVCMRSSGCTLEAVLPSREIRMEEQTIPVRCFFYREPVTGNPLFLFKMIWLPPKSPIHPSTEKPEKRPLWLKMAFTRRQEPPGAVFLARVRQVGDFETAWKIVETQMLAYLEFEGPPPVDAH